MLESQPASLAPLSVIQKMKGIIEMEGKFVHLNTVFTHMEVVLSYLENQFQEQQRKLPEPLQNCLERMHHALREAHDLIVRAESQPRCLRCCSLCNPKLSTQIRDWKTGFDLIFEELKRVFSISGNTQQIVSNAVLHAKVLLQLIDWKTGFDRFFEELERLFSLSANTQQIVSNAVPHAKMLLQPVPDSGLVGLTIEYGQMHPQAWLSDAHPRSGMTGVHGMGGVGKKSLLKLVSGIFDVVIWLRVSQKQR